ncbi:MAG: MoxR family ATPase [Candidatus Paceibacterota bacterium]|jgi:hypothetical protein
MKETPNKQPILSVEKDKDRELTPAEVVEHLTKLKQHYCKEFGEKTGAEIVFPKDTKIGDMDVSGKSLETVLNSFIARLNSYEPPIVQKQIEDEVKVEEESIPRWLKGHKELIWYGANDNPLWEVKAEQYKDEVKISYERRGQILNPGRDKEEQGRDIDTIKNTFTLNEWKILQEVIDQYISLERDLEDQDEEAKKKAREQILAIVREENTYRNDGGIEPKILKKKIDEIIRDFTKKTRGFRKESIDVEKLTQNVAEILSQLLVLNRTRGDGKEKIPSINPDTKEFPSFGLNMDNLIECLATQHAENKGITLMLGEAGTGKNVAVEHFAANTGRPFYWFPCGRGMEAIDLVAHYEFTTEEGTKRFLTDLVRGIQTPGAIVMIDEVNSLKPEVQAMLHGLGDGSRTMKYDGISIPVAEDVLIIIAGNPATYGSAGNLGEALLSRTRGQSMVMEYPALTKGELIARKEKWSKEFLEQREQQDNTLKDYACDEVLVLYGELNEFSDLNEEDFSLLWDVVVNEATQGSKITKAEENKKLSKLLKGSVKDHVRKTLVDMRDILRIADKWRKKFQRKEGGFDIVGVSMRDTIALMRAYKKERDVRKAYLTIIDDYKKNPIDGLEVTHAATERLINDVLGTGTTA